MNSCMWLKCILFVGGNGTPDSNRFSISGQTNNQQTYIRNGGGNDAPGNLNTYLTCHTST